MTDQTIYTQDETIATLARLAFPLWRGKKLRVVKTDGTVSIQDTAWNGGSRSSYVAIAINAGTFERIADVRRVNPLRERDERTIPIPVDVAIVEHSIFLGKDHGCTVYLHPNNVNALLAAETETDLTPTERITLCAARELKSSYRLSEATDTTGITETEYNAARDSLISRGLLRKNKSISDNGRNAIGRVTLFELRNALGRREPRTETE